MKNYLQKLLMVAALTIATATTNAQTVSTFEDFNLPADSFWNGYVRQLGTYFTDGNAAFSNYYDTAFGGGWATGFAYSNMTDTVTSGYFNPYSAKTGSGYNSATFAIGKQDNFVPKDIIINLLGNAKGKGVLGFYITNSTYAHNSMRDGDDFAKKFGGVTGNDADWFKVIIHAWLDGSKSTDSVEFYLADFRSSNNTEDYIVKDWRWVDLTGLGNADSLQFRMASSDAGDFGINTPTYFCMDNFTTGDFPSSVKSTGITNAKVYPVPATQYLNIYSTELYGKDVQVSITDMAGRVVYNESRKGLDMLGIDIRNLSAGIYFINMDGENISIKSKIVKD